MTDQNEDFIFSPISLQVVLLLTHAGAHGVTAEEMKAGLCVNLSKQDTLEGVKLVLDNLKVWLIFLCTYVHDNRSLG